jgi:hypothetical protein
MIESILSRECKIHEDVFPIKFSLIIKWVKIYVSITQLIFVCEKKPQIISDGIPAFFMTFTAAETKWAPLLISLTKRSKNRIITSEEALALPYHKESELIRNDPAGVS